MSTLFSNFFENNRPLFDILATFTEVMSFSFFNEEILPPLPEKSASLSVQKRNVGNNCYREKQCEEALRYYSQSVAFAPIDSEELALAYGNRSAVLFRIEKFELCLLDVNRALKGRLPKLSRQKLLTRKTDCWTRIQNAEKLKLDMKERLIKDFQGSSEITQRKFLLMNQQSQISIDQSDLFIDKSSTEDDPIWSTKFDNPLLPNFSSKVKFEFNEKWGRHLLATGDIEPGEVLLIEDISAFRIFNKEIFTHCAYCTLLCEALIPCPTCNLQMYCSEHCRQKAFDLYHRTECKVMPKIQKMVCHSKFKEDLMLVMRLFLIGSKQGTQLTSLMNDQNVYDSLEGKRNCVGIPYPNDYLSILNLLWRMNDDPTYSDDTGMFTGYLFCVLQRTDFFGNISNAQKRIHDFTDIELFAILLLYHHFSLIPQYCAGLYVQLLGPKFDFKAIGNGISSYQSLMNHSCDPNTFVLGDKRQLVFSLRPIKAGEQIFVSYSHIYWSKDLKSRREFFQKSYEMVCQCRACNENWPVYEDLMKKKNMYLTSNKNIIKKVEEMHHLLLLKKEAFPYMWHYKKEDLRNVFEFNKTIRQYVKEPSLTICLCERLIIECMKIKGPCYFLSPSESEAAEFKEKFSKLSL